MNSLYQEDYIKDLFKDDLPEDEKILWAGKPEFYLFSVTDIFLIPFSLVWGGFAIFWEVMVLFIKDKSGHGPPIIFLLFGIPFVLVGLYLIFGRFIFKAWKTRNTFYAVTDKRVMVLSRLIGRNLETAYINSLPGINKSVRSNGTGTIIFGNFPAFSSLDTNQIFRQNYIGSQSKAPIFYDIKDVNQVYELVNELRNKETPETSKTF